MSESAVIISIISIVIGFISGYITRYYKQKGKNKALKEDIANITSEKERIKSNFQLDIEKRKFQYESKKDNYLKYFNLLDNYTHKSGQQLVQIVNPISEKFAKDFMIYFDNKEKLNEVIADYSSELSLVMQDASKDFIQLKHETNSIRLIAGEEVTLNLNQLESGYEQLFDRSLEFIKNLASSISNQESLTFQMEEVTQLGNELIEQRNKLILSMKSELDSI